MVWARAANWRRWAVAVGACLPATLSAASLDVAGLERCKAIADPADRLACYDAAVGSAAPGPGLSGAAATAGSSATGASAPAPAPPVPAADSLFGLERRQVAPGPASIQSTIEGAFDGWRPRSLITLANGQVWQIVDESEAAYRLRDPGVRITRGMAGSFFLHVDSIAMTPRVRRIR